MLPGCPTDLPLRMLPCPLCMPLPCDPAWMPLPACPCLDALPGTTYLHVLPALTVRMPARALVRQPAHETISLRCPARLSMSSAFSAGIPTPFLPGALPACPVLCPRARYCWHAVPVFAACPCRMPYLHPCPYVLPVCPTPDFCGGQACACQPAFLRRWMPAEPHPQAHDKPCPSCLI